jgi:hypothetical protein
VRAGGRRDRTWSKAALVFLIVPLVTALAMLAGVPQSLTNLFALTYDGWKVGSSETCPVPNFDIQVGQPTTWDCDASLAAWLDAASEGFDRRDPSHVPIVRTTLHEYAGGARFLSNCCEVAVFELADGTIRAIGVAHVGVDYSRVSVVDYGPDR